MVLGSGYDRGVDFWALGVLIYELTTGETPFKLQDVSSKLRFKRVAMQEQINRKWRGHELKDATKSIIGDLLKYKSEDRLGMQSWDDIKDHEYFYGFHW